MTPVLPEFFLNLREWINPRPCEAIDPISKAGKPERYIEDWPGISPFIISSVLWSIYSFLRNRDSYWDAIATAISVGGDVDTTGAVTGAISGAWLGIEALPQHLIRILNDHGSRGYAELVALTEICYEIKCGI